MQEIEIPSKLWVFTKADQETLEKVLQLSARVLAQARAISTAPPKEKQPSVNSK
jgi:hypothetical protein